MDQEFNLGKADGLSFKNANYRIKPGLDFTT